MCVHTMSPDFAGYDNMEVNLDPVIDHIQAQNLKALEHEQNAKREAAMSKWQVYILRQQLQQPDCHVHCSCA